MQKIFPVLLLALVAMLPACQTAERALRVASSAANPTAFSDAEVAHIFLTANLGEVMTSEVGAQRAATEPVRMLSQAMVAHHNQTAQQTEQMAARARISLQPNKVSTHLDNTARATATRLRALSGAAFDRMHMESQVVMHQNTLDLLDHTLIPNARNADLAAMLRQARPVVAQHLDQARALHRQVTVAGR